MSLRKANAGDVFAIMEIINQAKAKLAIEGIDQWQDGYPNEDVIRRDISQGQAYVWDVGDKLATDPALNGVIAFVMLSSRPDPDYRIIEDGAWLTAGETYAVGHRLAVAVAYQGEGYAGQVLRRVAELAKESGHLSLRMDTHADNQAMQRTLLSSGFTACGRVYVRGTEPRLAFEKVFA